MLRYSREKFVVLGRCHSADESIKLLSPDELVNKISYGNLWYLFIFLLSTSYCPRLRVAVVGSRGFAHTEGMSR